MADASIIPTMLANVTHSAAANATASGAAASVIQSQAVLQVIVILVAGVFAARIAKKLDIPVIVPLLISGYLLGPDVLNIFNPADYGISIGLLAAVAVPVILFYDGLKIEPRTLEASWKTILSINTVAVLVTVFGIAGAASYFFGFSWTSAFLLGAILASTDPAAILPVLKKLNIDKRVSSILEAETAFNDAAALALFGVIIGVVAANSFSLQEGFSQFITLFFWSMLVGLMVGLAAREFLIRLKVERDLAFASFAVLFASFIVAQGVFNVSGAIAAVVAAVIFGEYVRSKHVDSIQRMYALSSWEDINFLAIAIVFLGLGSSLQLSKILPFLFPGMVIAFLFMYVVRLGAIVLSMVFDKSFSLREKLFISLIGAPRGTVSAALASSALVMAPIGVLGGGDMESVFYITLVVIVTTVVATSLSATRIATKLLGASEDPVEEKYRTLKVDLKAMMVAAHRLRDEWKSGLLSNRMYDELNSQQAALIKAAEHQLTMISRTHPDYEMREKLDRTRGLVVAQINSLEEAYTNKEISEKSYDELLEKYNAVLGRLSELEAAKGRRQAHGGGR
ncbi:MAG: sodium:proton antiporter [Candidatus Micrarchaeota archaeon]|nr:sodium:proton antiporter [Candidatus Micrarchaeota archaeon]